MEQEPKEYETSELDNKHNANHDEYTEDQWNDAQRLNQIKDEIDSLESKKEALKNELREVERQIPNLYREFEKNRELTDAEKAQKKYYDFLTGNFITEADHKQTLESIADKTGHKISEATIIHALLRKYQMHDEYIRLLEGGRGLDDYSLGNRNAHRLVEIQDEGFTRIISIIKKSFPERLDVLMQKFYLSIKADIWDDDQGVITFEWLFSQTGVKPSAENAQLLFSNFLRNGKVDSIKSLQNTTKSEYNLKADEKDIIEGYKTIIEKGKRGYSISTSQSVALDDIQELYKTTGINPPNDLMQGLYKSVLLSDVRKINYVKLFSSEMGMPVEQGIIDEAVEKNNIPPRFGIYN